MCVSTHYSALIPSNAVWSLEAGTLISCFFPLSVFTNSSRRLGKRISILEAEMRRQKIAGEVESRNLVRQLLMCLQKDDEKKPASTGPGAGWGWALQAVGHKSSRGMKCPWSSVQAGTVPGPAEAGQEVCGQPLTSGKPRSVPDDAPPPTHPAHTP